MPFCTVLPGQGGEGKEKKLSADDPVRIFYRTYGEGDCKIIMIMGVAATHTAWWPQIKPLTGTDIPNEPDDPEISEEETSLAALRPAEGPEQAKTAQRIKSDLGHRLMMHGAQALAEGSTSPVDSATSCLSRGEHSSSSSGSEVDGPAQTSVFERLDSESIRGVRDRRDDHLRTIGEEAASAGRQDILTGRVACVFDNRGVGRSSHPVDPKCYRTDIMAMDALAVADKLGWEKFHVIGHSMGGMISCKLAALAPHRVISLAVISASSGGFDCVPRLEMRPLKMIHRMISAKTPEQRAAVDLDCHFSQNFLSEMVDGIARREHLHKEYVSTLKTKGAMQPKHAQHGQLSACWNHGMTSGDVRSITRADIPVTVIHGSDDIVAHVSLGRRIAKRLDTVARFVELWGGHMVIREKIDEVNGALIELLDAASMGMRGASWVQGDPCREEKELRLVHCLSGSCGDCSACMGPEPIWPHVLDAI